MVHILPTSRRDLIKRLRRLGFEGPYSGGRHEFMLRGIRRLTLPNPHRSEIGVDLLSRLLRQAEIGHEEWESSKD
ncbi:MAG: type II toxin-antitoxin system HicA family toxin [Acidobacteriota bacterium]|jgi:predicted RNA binding protein YcfA (HicA-like mRNA interferase family)|nr:type II toxin-antitoxin system HicA family toxin [Acidobacteriota bacterium]